MISWIKNHKYYVIGVGVILLVILAAFLWKKPTSQDGTKPDDAGTTVTGQDLEETPAVEKDSAVQAETTATSEAISTSNENVANGNTEKPADRGTAQTTGKQSETSAGTGELTEAPAITTVTASEATTAAPTVTHTCTIQIACATVLDHMDTLDSSKVAFVPSNGLILSTTSVTFTEGETVYDVLQRTCQTAGIQMDAYVSTAYKTAYVRGINNLYEFDCGSMSGWKYCVNGTYPNYGCSSYILKEGDVIQWNYTCENGDV